MKQELSFMNDVLFKYCMGKNNDSSQYLRNFILEYILGDDYKNLRVTNPELIPSMLKQKNLILDILLENEKLRIGIDMQATSLSRLLYKRFQQYLSRLCSDQVVVGDKYEDIKPAIMILFVKDYNEETPSLIINKMMIDTEYQIPLPYPLQKFIIIQLPYIEKIVTEKVVLNEFEALIYLIYKNTLEGIHYEEKEGVIKIMENKKKEFVKEEPELYEAAMKHQYMTIDYDVVLEDAKEEYKEKWMKRWMEEGMKQGLEQGLELGLEKGMEKGLERGMEKGVEKGVLSSVLSMIQIKYNEDASLWVNQCSLEQLKKITHLCFQNISYEELQRKTFE